VPCRNIDNAIGQVYVPVYWSKITEKQQAQLMLTNPRDAFRGQSRSPNIVPFHMLGILSSSATVTLSLILIFDFKMS